MSIQLSISVISVGANDARVQMDLAPSTFNSRHQEIAFRGTRLSSHLGASRFAV